MTTPTTGLMLSRRFGPLFAAQFLGAFNDNLLKSALGVLAAYRLSGWAGLDAGALAMLAGATFIAPFVLFSGAAGTLADRVDKTRIVRAVKLAEIAIMALGTAGLVAQSMPALLVALFLLGTHSAVFGPVKYAILPQHLAPAELVAGNALVDAGTFLAILAGTLLGAALVLAPHGPVWLAAIGLAAAAGGWIAAAAMPDAPPLGTQTPPRPRMIADSIAVLRYALAEEGLRGPILALSWFWALGAVVVSGLPVLARETLGAAETAVNLMLALFALGIGAGSMLAIRLQAGAVTGWLVPWAALAMAASSLVVALGAAGGVSAPAPLADILGQPPVLRFLAGLAGLAVAGGAFAVPLYALLLRRSDPAHRARVIAANNIANALAMATLSVAAAALLGAGWSMPVVIGGCGAAGLAVAASWSRRGG